MRMDFSYVSCSAVAVVYVRLSCGKWEVAYPTCLKYLIFDTVSHNILLGKLRKYGLDELLVKWI